MTDEALKISVISKGVTYTVLIDPCDAPLIENRAVCLKSGYAVIWINKKVALLHRVILGVTDPKIEVDHKDRNPLNNQRSNLRICTRSQNVANTKLRGKYKGACYDRNRRLYRSYIKVNYRQIHLGRFATEEEAARAYDEAAKKYFGEFACLNFPSED